MFIKENKVHLDLRNSSTGLGTYKIMKNFSNMINLHMRTHTRSKRMHTAGLRTQALCMHTHTQA